MKKLTRVRKNISGGIRRPQSKPTRFPECAELKAVVVREERSATALVRFTEPSRVLDLWRSVVSKSSWYHEDKEHLVCLFLDTRYHLKGYSLVSMGSLNECIAHPREVFRTAIASAAYSIIVAHNHPSGDVRPSITDLALTRRLSAAGELLQIPLLDHVIVSDQATSPRGRTCFSMHNAFSSWPPPKRDSDEWHEASPKRRNLRLQRIAFIEHNATPAQRKDSQRRAGPHNRVATAGGFSVVNREHFLFLGPEDRAPRKRYVTTTFRAPRWLSEEGHAMARAEDLSFSQFMRRGIKRELGLIRAIQKKEVDHEKTN